MQKSYLFVFSVIASACFSTAFAAKPINVANQSMALLNNFSSNQSALTQTSAATDFNQTTHIRIKQTYAGVPVLGSDIVVHIPSGSNTSFTGLANNKNANMNGILFQDLMKDLGATPALQNEKMLQHAMKLYQNKSGNLSPVSEGKADLKIYVDDTEKAHWVYQISFLVSPKDGLPAKPSYIMDAKTSEVYREWDNIQTHEDTLGGGFGGNSKTTASKFTYDGLENNLPKLNIDRNADTGICYLKNSDVRVKHRLKNDAIVQYACTETNSEHDHIWWSGDHDAINGAYSPGNDALYAGRVIQDMYLKWYGVPALVNYNGDPMVLTMRVHENMENAYWDGSQMTFGDGGSMFYPLVSLGVGAHEVSHGFTEQHSELMYWSQSGGLNESFSDMAAQAAEFYSTGHNSWEIGPEIMKDEDVALRYMIKPSTDCFGGRPGSWCSIDKVSQYKEGLDVHYSSGIFNRIFYLIGSAKGWDTKKAFDIMVQANQFYWTSYTSWKDAACGVLKATEDYKYDLHAVKKAFDKVELDYSKC